MTVMLGPALALCAALVGAGLPASHPSRGSVGGCPGGDVCVSAAGGLGSSDSVMLEPEYFSGPQTCHMVAFQFDRVYNASTAPVHAYATQDCTSAGKPLAPGKYASIRGQSFTIG